MKMINAACLTWAGVERAYDGIKKSTKLQNYGDGGGSRSQFGCNSM